MTPIRRCPLGAMTTPTRLFMLCALLSILLLDVDAVATSFSHFFRYERTSEDGLDTVVVLEPNGSSNVPPPVLTTPTPTGTKRPVNINPNAARRDTYGLAAMIRWNTYTILPDFGMETGARVEIEISNLTYTSFPAVYSSRLIPVVFSLYDIDQWRAYAVLRMRDMPLKSPTILCHYPAAFRYTLTERSFRARRNTTSGVVRVVFDVKRPSLYTLQVQVCGDASVFVAGNAKMVNRGFDNSLSEHLAVEELGRVSIYQGLIVIYSVFAFLWIVEGYIRRKTSARLAYVFQAALHVKTLEAFLKLWFYRELSLRGQRDTIFKAVKDVAESAASAILLSVMLLAALGWSLTRDELTRRERRFMGASFVFYVFIALMKATCTSDDDDVCKAYMLTEYLIKSLMMLGVIVALNFTIGQLRLALNEGRWNNHVSPLMYMKLNQFQNLRFIFLTYLLVPTALLILNLTVVTPVGYWRYDWLNYFLDECCTLTVFVGIALNMRPIDTYIFALISRGTDTGGPATRNAPPSPNLPAANVALSGNVAEPATIQDPSRTATEQVLESNRRLLREYATTTATTPPMSPSRNASPRLAPAPVSLMMTPLGRRPL